MQHGTLPMAIGGIASTARSDPASSGPAAPPFPSAHTIRALARKQLDRFFSYQPKVMKGTNPEAIHDMRVASRRLQQVMDLIYPKPRPQEVRKLRRQLVRTRRALGDLRNCDVLLEMVRYRLERKRSARREAWEAVQHFIQARRAKSFERAARKLGKLNLAACYVSLRALLYQEEALAGATEHDHATGSNQGAAAPPQVSEQSLTTALESVWSRFEDQIEHSRRTARPEVIHAARIATKRLRYLLEVCHELGIAGSADALAWLRQLQNHLGNWHDLVVLEEMMIEAVTRPEFLRDHLRLAMEVEKLMVSNRAAKTRLEEKYAQSFRDSEDLRRLKEWVAYALASPSAALARS